MILPRPSSISMRSFLTTGIVPSAARVSLPEKSHAADVQHQKHVLVYQSSIISLSEQNLFML
jgi:hypothetical protein